MSGSEKTVRVQQYLTQHKLEAEVIEFDQSTRTAAEAASAIGCEVGQIVKSLVFRCGEKPILFLVSGMNHVDMETIRPLFKDRLKLADANFTREKTGYAIGGVPPIAHEPPLETFMDEALLEYEFVWAAAGTPHSVFQIKSQDLLRFTTAKSVKVS